MVTKVKDADLPGKVKEGAHNLAEGVKKTGNKAYDYMKGTD